MSYVIGVCGASCSGKTKAVKSIVESLNNKNEKDVTILSQDSYYFPGNSSTNFDLPESIDFSLMISHLKDLLNGKTIESPIYDFSKHSRSLETNTLFPAKIIILEGILIFTQKELRNLINLKVFISTYGEIAFSRRLKRDVEERKRTVDEVTERYFKDVLPSSRFYVEPSESYADIVLKNNIQGQFIGLTILLDHIYAKLN